MFMDTVGGPDFDLLESGVREDVPESLVGESAGDAAGPGGHVGKDGLVPPLPAVAQLGDAVGTPHPSDAPIASSWHSSRLVWS